MPAADRRWRAAALALAALVCWLSLTPQPPKPPGAPSGSDLAAHLAMHLALAGALARAFPAAGPAVAAFLAVYLEVAQAVAPGRDFSLADLAMNGLGCWAGLRAARAYVASITAPRKRARFLSSASAR